MEPLITITTIPISYELKIQNARLEHQSSTAELEISRNKGNFTIKSRPIKLNIDTYDARNSVVPNTKESIRQAAEKGKSASYEATATMAKESQLLLKAKIDDDVLGDIFRQRAQQPTGDFALGFIPTSQAKLSWTPPDLTIRYEMDRLNFDLKVANGNFEFIPGDIELVIEQMPDVKIEYIGKPLYVPPSASENFIDIKV